MELPAVVGRHQLIDELVSAYNGDHVCRALVTGGPGYGKTALASTVVGALDQEVTSVTVFASRMLSDAPFGALALVLPSPPVGDDQSPVAVLRALQTQLEDLAAKTGRTPIVLVENAHALDEHSAAALAQVTTAELAHLLILARPVPELPQGFQSLCRDGLLTRYDLPLLSDEEVHELCVQILGADVGRGATQVLARESGGNPYALLALLEQEQRVGHLTKRNGVWIMTAEPAGPDPLLVDAVTSKIATDDDERSALEAVSLTEPLPLAVLLEITTPETVDALETGCLITIAPDGRRHIRVAPPLYGKVIRQSVPLSRRIRIRNRVLQMLEPDSLSEEGLVRDVSWELERDIAVSDRRLLRSAVLANRALDTRAALRAAAAVGQSSLAGAASVQAARAHFSKGQMKRAQRVLTEAVKEISDLPTRAAAALLQAQLLMNRGADPDELHQTARDWRADIERIAASADRESPDREAAQSRLGSDLMTLLANNLQGEFEEGETALQQIISHPSGNDQTRMMAFALLGELLDSTGRPESGTKATAESLGCLRAHGWRYLHRPEFIVTRHVAALISSGRWSETRDTITEYLNFKPAGGHRGGFFHLAAGWILVRQGQMRSALGELRLAIESLRVSDPGQLLPLALGFGAYAAALSGAPDTATEYADSFADLPYRGSADQSTIGSAYVAFARAAMTNLSIHGAELHRLANEAGEKNLAAAQQVVLELLLRTGDTSRLDDLIDVTDRNEGPAAAVLNAQARALRAKDARGLMEASEDAAAAGYLLISAECAGCAAALPEGQMANEVRSDARRLVRERRAQLEESTTFWLDSASGHASSTGHELLTRRQQDIATLVAEGLTNREIADELNISHRTVEGHLYQMFTKLDITSREELPSVF